MFNVGQAGLNVRFSPFQQTVFAMAVGENFGIVGKGETILLESVSNQPQCRVLQRIPQTNAVFDVCFDEKNEQVVYSGLGTGEIAIDFQSNISQKQQIKVHDKEINSLNINSSQNHLLLSASNDRSCKLLDLNRLHSKQQFINEEFRQHLAAVHEVQWHPVNGSLFATACQDSQLRLFDLNDPRRNIVSIRAHEGEIMSLDFNKYQEQIVTGSTDKTIRIWDLRKLQVPINIMSSHRYPVKRVRYSPHQENIIGSCSLSILADYNECVVLVI